MKEFLLRLHPLQLLIYGYIFLLLLGFLLLQAPFCQTLSTGSLDNFFVATSALSTTGLSTLDVSQAYTFWGQLVILMLIQIGGLGYMSLGSFFVLSRKRQLSVMQSDLLTYDFSLPQGFDVGHFIKSMVLFTLVIEAVGALLLAWVFHAAGEDNVVWNGVFHSISAFCTAGFSLFSDGFVPFQNNFSLNLLISVLAISGALGFIVFTDFYESITNKKAHITYTSRIILRFTFVGILLGALVLYLSDPNIETLPPETGLMTALFQSMSAFTTVGFNTYDIGAIVPAPMFTVILLMVIGASPSGTGGGMKSTTFTALFAQLRGTFRGDSQARFMGRVIPPAKVGLATSNFFFYMLTLAVGTYLLLLVQEEDPYLVLFEVVSALGTVGLSAGLTGTLTVMGKIILIILMFLGRIGPLSFGMAVFSSNTDTEDGEVEDLAI
ncbi:TrkH family potassium uptake protein [Neolewinella antarctica]|uniref:Trk system potassium uptake protein TrkH n=1 Tax=Neolewinella antarctica TaxID=442734 RepID=A0ABX0X6C2_9BACT|nr:potassium transporter TrkG [Neolewinella antarctica]NJC24544.1 trk system potassium uptake protein TrkH [Neolewinella antarctica]